MLLQLILTSKTHEAVDSLPLHILLRSRQQQQLGGERAPDCRVLHSVQY